MPTPKLPMEDEVLMRMLKTSPKPHKVKPAPAKKRQPKKHQPKTKD